MENKIKVAILASGNGSNAINLCKHATEHQEIEISFILTDREDAQIIQKANEIGITSYIESGNNNEREILRISKEHEVDWIFLAGYMRILSSNFLENFYCSDINKCKVVNIHPSLLPLHRGLESYERSYNDELPYSGISVHMVDSGIDTGEILYQYSFNKLKDESLEDFKKRGLSLEHQAYPLVFNYIKSCLKTKNPYYRIEVYSKFKDMNKAKVYWINSPELTWKNIHEISETILIDPVSEYYIVSSEEYRHALNNVIEVSFKPGVTDNRANSTKMAINLVRNYKDINVHTGDLYLYEHRPTKHDFNEHLISELSNPLLQNASLYNTDSIKFKNRFIKTNVSEVVHVFKNVEEVNINIELDELMKINKERCWAFSVEELRQVLLHFSDEEVMKKRLCKGLPKNPNDIEIEILAQSWSEHCKHKIFAANINLKDNTLNKSMKVSSLYKSYIKKATYDVRKDRNIDWLISVFSDNAGIVRFDSKIDYCAKVETHNSPSVLDPYGGSLTGILGVNRDIMGCGIGAKPIANMDVFCFADETLTTDRKVLLPSGLKDPSEIQKGVHRGIVDGGNKSGIPTVNGSIHYHDQYAGKPLVYVGTVGVIPQVSKVGLSSEYKGQACDDYVVMAGGRIGADGIHGATFSSIVLDENAPSTAVQIGDPFTQKKLLDFQLKARDLGLYTSVTDNGAGGLSSSVGEMAIQTGGAKIDLALCPTKYPGLAPYELMISESQERMTFSVAKSKWYHFSELAKQYDVEVSNIGVFTNTGSLVIQYHGKTIADLELTLIHDDLEPMELEAEYNGKKNFQDFKYWHNRDFRKPSEGLNQLDDIFKDLLSSPNIRSKQDLISQYDSGVQGATLQAGFQGKSLSGPTDAAVIHMEIHGSDKNRGLVISNGLNPHLSYSDSYDMAVYSIDEAIRNIVATGGNPNKLALLDNFCWPDPLKNKNNPDYKDKTAALVRCCEGLYDTAMIYGTPFISGKDSMKNDYIGKDKDGNDLKISVPATLLITAISDLPDTNFVNESTFNTAGDHIYLVGRHHFDKFYISEYTKTKKINQQQLDSMPYDVSENKFLYDTFYKASQRNLISSAHDVSDGGTICSLIESCFGNNVGAVLDLSFIEDEKSIIPYLTNEGTGIFIVSVSSNNHKEFTLQFEENIIQKIGFVTDSPSIEIKYNKNEILNSSVDEYFKAWRGKS